MFSRRQALFLVTLALVPVAAYPQTTLTGATWFASTPTGAGSVAMGYADGAENTVGGDQWYNLWLALNPDATSPVNGPSDAQASISIPLQVGKSYKYYIFGVGPCCSLSFSGFNLFFNGDGSTPGISVFGALNTTNFLPNSSSTLSLGVHPVAGSGKSFYTSAGVTVVLTGYDWNDSSTPPGDVCQAFSFTPVPGGAPSTFGSFSLLVLPAATLSLGEASGSPGTRITLAGSGFNPSETVAIYAGHIGVPPLFTVTAANASGTFDVTALEPQHPYGPMDVYALGLKSGKLGAATLLVTPELVVSPAIGAPGGTVTAYGLGFGANETVDIYWGQPRQLLGTATANGEGSSALKITIPANAPAGLNGVVGVGQTTQAIGIGAIEVE
jgi:hypothetical protein